MAHQEGNAINRRSMLRGTAATAGLVLAGESASAAERRVRAKATVAVATTAAVKTYTNADFYDAAKKFLPEKAKEAYFAMFARFGYPLPDSLRKGMWVLDFGMGDFVHAGMGGIFWLNRKEYGYMGHEIFLLPGQMIPEHYHVKTDGPAKMESWHVRYGMIYTFGEGAPTVPLPVKLPESQLPDGITCKHCEPLLPGELRDLNRLEARHFMYAGPEGAIVTEYGSYHDMAGLKFTNPRAKVTL